MPGLKNTTKPQGRYAKCANAKNVLAVEKAMSGEGIFARVEKSLGNRQFKIIVWHADDTLTLTASPRGVFSAGGKARVYISIGDIVLIEGKIHKDTIVEITGRLDKKQAQDLFKAGRIDKAVYKIDEIEDDLFDYKVADDAEADIDIDDV
jgi:translation initiation factor IF-1